MADELDTSAKVVDAADIVGITDDPVGDDVVDPATGTEEGSQEVTKEVDPGKVSAPDVSFLSDAIQKTMEENPEVTLAEALKLHQDEFKQGYKRLDSYSKGQNELREEREALGQAKIKAERYDALTRDQEVAEFIRGRLDKKPDEIHVPEPPEDFDMMTPTEQYQWQAKANAAMLAKTKADAKAEAIAELKAEMSAPYERVEMLNDAIMQFAEDNEVPDDVITAAGKLLESKDYVGTLHSATKEQLPGLFHMAVGLVQRDSKLTTLETSRKSEQEKLTKARTASPSGAGGTAAAEKRTFAEVNGREVTADDVFDQWLARRGFTEADVDAG